MEASTFPPPSSEPSATFQSFLRANKIYGSFASIGSNKSTFSERSWFSPESFNPRVLRRAGIALVLGSLHSNSSGMKGSARFSAVDRVKVSPGNELKSQSSVLAPSGTSSSNHRAPIPNKFTNSVSQKIAASVKSGSNAMATSAKQTFNRATGELEQIFDKIDQMTNPTTAAYTTKKGWSFAGQLSGQANETLGRMSESLKQVAAQPTETLGEVESALHKTTAEIAGNAKNVLEKMGGQSKQALHDIVRQNMYFPTTHERASTQPSADMASDAKDALRYFADKAERALEAINAAVESHSLDAKFPSKETKDAWNATGHSIAKDANSVGRTVSRLSNGVSKQVAYKTKVASHAIANQTKVSLHDLANEAKNALDGMKKIMSNPQITFAVFPSPKTEASWNAANAAMKKDAHSVGQYASNEANSIAQYGAKVVKGASHDIATQAKAYLGETQTKPLKNT
eukprot:jgi/Bigna1/89198/estExt_fgenesh1_pg.C_450074